MRKVKSCVLLLIVLLMIFGLAACNKKVQSYQDKKIEKKSLKAEEPEKTSKPKLSKEQNNKMLLEYAMKHFDVQTRVFFADLTHDGMDELLVYDDKEYIHPEVESMITTVYIYSVIGEHW